MKEKSSLIEIVSKFNSLSQVEIEAAMIEAFQNGASLEEKNPKGETALFIASKNGLMRIINFLIQKGAKINSTDKNGRTALFSAIEGSKRIAVQKLIDQGININKQDKKGVSPLMFAAQNNEHKIIELLLDYQAQTFLRDKNEKNALDYAQENKASEAITILSPLIKNENTSFDKKAKRVLFFYLKDLPKDFPQPEEYNISERICNRLFYLHDASMKIPKLPEGPDFPEEDQNGLRIGLPLIDAFAGIEEILYVCDAPDGFIRPKIGWHNRLTEDELKSWFASQGCEIVPITKIIKKKATEANNDIIPMTRSKDIGIMEICVPPLTRKSLEANVNTGAMFVFLPWYPSGWPGAKKRRRIS